MRGDGGHPGNRYPELEERMRGRCSEMKDRKDSRRFLSNFPLSSVNDIKAE